MIWAIEDFGKGFVKELSIFTLYDDDTPFLM